MTATVGRLLSRDWTVGRRPSRRLTCAPPSAETLAQYPLIYTIRAASLFRLSRHGEHHLRVFAESFPAASTSLRN